MEKLLRIWFSLRQSLSLCAVIKRKATIIMIMPPSSEENRLQRNKHPKISSKSPITDFIRIAKKNSGNKLTSKIDGKPKEATPVPLPILQTRIPQAFQQVYIASNRGEEVSPVLVQQLPRTRSCFSSQQMHRSLAEPTVHKTPRTVSFGSVEGFIVKNIARDNKNALWFSRDEYTCMREEALQIANASRKQGYLKESINRSSRGLEKYVSKDPWQSQYARKSVLEHNDLAMYSLASNRAVHTARQLAELDALEAFKFQNEKSTECLPRQHSRRKLFSP